MNMHRHYSIYGKFREGGGGLLKLVPHACVGIHLSKVNRSSIYMERSRKKKGQKEWIHVTPGKIFPELLSTARGPRVEKKNVFIHAHNIHSLKKTKSGLSLKVFKKALPLTASRDTRQKLRKDFPEPELPQKMNTQLCIIYSTYISQHDIQHICNTIHVIFKICKKKQHPYQKNKSADRFVTVHI